MEVGKKVKFDFGKKKEKKEGIVTKVFDKTVYLKVDFKNHKGKTVVKRKNEVK